MSTKPQHHQNEPTLAEVILNLYPKGVSVDEAAEAAFNLVGLCEVLMEIHQSGGKKNANGQ